MIVDLDGMHRNKLVIPASISLGMSEHTPSQFARNRWPLLISARMIFEYRKEQILPVSSFMLLHDILNLKQSS